MTALAAVAAGPISSAGAVTLPAGFTDEHVASVVSPTALAFTPDGRLLIATQPGALRVRTQAQGLLGTPAIDLAARLCANSERGLLGLAVDPGFASNRYVYLFYTLNKFSNSCPTSGASTPVNRVSRFVLPDSNVIDPTSETVLVDNIPSYNGNHNAGDLNFGKDGNLYVSTGDGGCDYAGGGCAGSNDAARDEFVLLGKIVRITPSGGIPADNPFQGGGTARCSITGRTTAGLRCQETYAWGLRNPFRFAMDPNAADTRLYINDVGQHSWEEIDEGVPGADYGWNVREGFCANGSTTNCGPPPAGMTNPIFAYGRADGCTSITGGAFVPAAAWPPPYAGTYLFGDFVCGRIFQLVPNGSGGFTRLPFAEGLGPDSAVHLEFGPRGAQTALYYTSWSGGAVRRIFYTPGNQPPTAAFTVGASRASLDVTFDGSASSDPDAGDTLTYVWSFGDGSLPVQTPVPTTEHTYPAPGTYEATLRVRDNHGAESAPTTVTVNTGNSPPVPTISSPADGQRFAVGETILLRGEATDAEDGTLPASALSWTLIRRHATHIHPYLGPVTGNGASFEGPAPEDLLATTNSSIEVRLTATDAHGATATVTRIVEPRHVNLRFDTRPGGLTLVLNETPFSAPRTWVSWEGWEVSASAPDAGELRFSAWSDGGARTHAVRTPGVDLDLTATFAWPPADPPPPPPEVGEPAPPPEIGEPAPRACIAPTPTRSLAARVKRRLDGGRRIVATARTRIGPRRRARYRIRLLRGCTLVATGYVHGRAIALSVRRDEGGSYRRVRGTHLLEPVRSGALPVTTVRFGS